ncbi:ImmA/IrrE family metallo-endopeptidase [Paenibacillus sp. IHBB 3054]|uniref:ImmA/IrrE family metallo-endopeptidase n=1 Tax=Paenibacillus sp. IHBB 3054 TaxID=3425689 RepID=UPI003F6732D8
MMMMMIFKPNYKKAELAANAILLGSKTKEFPIKVKQIAKKFTNLRIRSYSWFAKKQSMSIQEVCEFAESEEGCCYYNEAKKDYLILYNDLVQTPGRVRWTLAHELGHYVLKHNEISDRTTLGRSSLSKSEYDVLEKEANCFARSLLAPPSILFAMRTFNAFDLSYWFGLSTEAAANTLRFFRKGIEQGVKFNPLDKVYLLFKEAIHNKNNEHFCMKCSNSFVLTNPIYCPVCGSKRIFKRGKKVVKYEGYPLDEQGKALICPRCNNEDIHSKGEYCPVCGLMLVNRCTGYKFIDSSYEDESVPCGTIVPGYARCCHICGCSTTYYESGILPAWDEKGSHSLPNHTSTSRLVIVPNRETKAVNSNYGQISEEDLPF